MKFQHAEREYRGDPKPGDIVGAVISYGPEHARHHMLIKGDWTSCELRATQFEGGVAQMVAVVNHNYCSDTVPSPSPNTSP